MGQFLNCIFESSRIVLLTIQELSKAQCNNTDNNYIDYSDTNPILSDFLIQTIDTMWNDDYNGHIIY